MTPSIISNRAARGSSVGCLDWKRALNIDWLKDKVGGSARLKGLGGAILSIAIGTGAVFALTHALKNTDYEKVFAIIHGTEPSVLALALVMVTASYASITLYDWLALHTMGRRDVPYRIAAVASFTSYPIAHGIGAVALISPVIRYRIYSGNGVGALGVANICFLTGLTFWLGNMTALGFSLLYQPAAIGVIDHLPAWINRALALVLLGGVAGFLLWSWLHPRQIGRSKWLVRLPSGPLVLVQIVVGLLDLSAAAISMNAANSRHGQSPSSMPVCARTLICASSIRWSCLGRCRRSRCGRRSIACSATTSVTIAPPSSLPTIAEPSNASPRFSMKKTKSPAPIMAAYRWRCGSRPRWP